MGENNKIMLSNNDLSSIFELFGQGLIIGGLLSGIPFILGYTVNAILKFIRS